MIRRINIISFLIFIILGWKLNRLILPHINTYIWDLHIFFLIIFAALIIFIIPRKIKVNDLIIFSLIAILLLSSIVRSIIFDDVSGEIYYLVNYLLPIPFYFWGRYIVLKKEEYFANKLLLNIFILFIFLESFNYISANFTSDSFINRNLGNILFQGTRSFTADLNTGDFPIFLDVVYRPLGISGTQYATSSLILGISFYIYYMKNEFFSFGNTALIIGFLLTFFYAVGTTYLIFLIIFFLISSKKISLKLIYLPLFFIGIYSILYGKQVLDIAKFVYDYLLNISHAESNLIYFFLGGGYQGYSDIAGEIYLLTLPFVIGIVPFILILYLLYKNISFNEFSMGHKILIIVIILCSIHYNTLFMYPNSLIFFFIIGHLTSKQSI